MKQARGPVLKGLVIERWAHGGDGVAVPRGGDLAGAVVFMRGVVPGDVVDARIVTRKKRWARAEVVAVTSPSPGRVASACDVHERCGGCPWILGDAASQAGSRLAILRGEAAKTLGWDEATLDARVALAPDPADATRLGYRVRVRLAYRRLGAESVLLGFRGHRSAELVDIATCAVAHPALNAALPAVRRAIASGDGGDPRASGEVAMVTGGDAVGAWVLPEGDREGYALPGLAEDETLDARGFAQANPAVVRAIEAHVERLARAVAMTEPVAVELFAGDGALTGALWRAGFAVTAYELDARAGEGFRARRDAACVPEARGRWHQADLLGIGAPLPPPARSPDLVLLDPPRAGASAVMPWVRGTGAEVVLVSCDVATAMRDLAILCEGGAYDVRAITGYDMFPHTGHQELVAHAVHANPDRGYSTQ